MRRSICIYRAGFLAVALFLVLVSFRTSSAAPEARGLSLVQLEKLVQIHTPDDVVAQEVRARGLDFTPTPKILDGLQRHGAGQATLAAVRERMPVGTIEIQGPPGSKVTVDGIDRGTADNQGRLVLMDLPAGNHRLVVTKAGYRPGDFKVTLSAREKKIFPVQLDWTGGFLTVHSNPPGASIEIEGLGQFNGEVSDLQCPPGTYHVTVVRPGMKSETRSVAVAAGQHGVVDITLARDPKYFETELANAKQRLAQGDAQGAMPVLTNLLSIEPNNSDALSLLAEVYWQTHDTTHFEDIATNAIGHGGSVKLDVAHEHLEMSGEAIHSATLTITAKSIAYDPGGNACKYAAFAVPLENLETIDVTNKTTSGFMVVRHLAQDTFLLHLDFRDAAKSSKKKMTLYYATPDSQINQQNNGKYLVSPSGSSQALNALAAVLRSTKATTAGR